jgi:xanthine dehydrogenase YagS FAD-binding subunit
MKALAYERAQDARSAQAAVSADDEAMFLAGGTNLVDLMKLGVTRPARLIDIRRLGLDAIEHRSDGSLLIGATVTNSTLAADPGVRERFPLLSEAILAGASGQLRNMATTAGNLLQRTRCVYFTDTTKPCNKREPGSGCPAIAGAHRDLALLGTSDQCVATHPSDMAVALAALDAMVIVQRAGGAQERLALDAFYLEPGETPQRETVLQAGDLITGVEVPAPPLGAQMAYRKVRDRWSYAFALVSVAALVVTDEDGAIRDLRLGLGGVATRPWRARVAERMLLTDPPRAAGSEAVRVAVSAEFAHARPLPDNAFKAQLAADTAAAAVAALTGTEDLR